MKTQEPQVSSDAEQPGDVAVRGMATPMGDERYTLSNNLHAGTREEYDALMEMLADLEKQAASIYVASMDVMEERELTREETTSIITLLQTAPIGVYETLGNPPTGGVVFELVAYDAMDRVYLRVLYNGWLIVQPKEDDRALVFDGENSDLRAIGDIIV